MKLKVRSEGECSVNWKQRLSIKLEHTAEADTFFLDNTRKVGFQMPMAQGCYLERNTTNSHSFAFSAPYLYE